MITQHEEFLELESNKNRIRRQTKNEILFLGDPERLHSVINIPEDGHYIYEPFAEMISTVFADLLFGGDESRMPFELMDVQETQTTNLDDLKSDNSDMQKRLHKAALMASALGELVLEVYQESTEDGEAGRIRFNVVDPRLWEPVESIRGGEVVGHIIRNVFFNESEDYFVYQREHRAGVIYHSLFMVNNKGDLTDPNKWMPTEFARLGPSWDPQSRGWEFIELEDQGEHKWQYKEDTGVDVPLAMHVPNVEVFNTVHGRSDYDGKRSMFKALSHLTSKGQKAIANNADPKDVMSEENAESIENDPRIKSVDDITYYTEGEGTKGIHRKITWDANMSALFEQRKHIEEKLALYSGIAPSLFGHTSTSSNIPDSGIAMKIMYARTLQAVYKRQRIWDVAIKWFANVYGQIKSSTPLLINVEWSSTLPENVIEKLQELELQYALDIKSKQTIRQEALTSEGKTQEEIDSESQRISDENTLEGNPKASWNI